MFRHVQIACVLSAGLIIAAVAPGNAASLQVLHRFTDTGNSTKSQYKLGASPQAELLQASDGNLYGTAVEGGSGACPDPGNPQDGKIVGCETIFRMTPQGTVTALYSFPYNASTGAALNGAYPTAGLIQAQDGYLYGVARYGGGLGNCFLGCGTMFRISTAGVFTRLHRFCSGSGCANPVEGTVPTAHLVQMPSGALCGTTSTGGFQNNGTVYCASTSGSVNTIYGFQPSNGTDGADPVGALLVGMDGQTLYGTTTFGGAGGQGVVFALKGGVLTNLHAFTSRPIRQPNPNAR